MTAAMARHTRSLGELAGDDAPAFGGKSASLGELLRAQIPVPPGFALGVSAFAQFLERPGLTQQVAEALASVGPQDVDALSDAAEAIGNAMRATAVPDAVRSEIELAYANLAALTGLAEPPVAVRSSALGEDTEQATFAGQQDTYLWVRGSDAICRAVRDCWASLYSTEAISYRLGLAGGTAQPAMGVTVQLMVDSAVSGVMFTCNPVSGDPSMVAINASWGLGLAVVGGEVTPDDYLLSKVTREVVRQTTGDKQVEYSAAPDGHGTIRIDVDPERRNTPCLDAGALSALVELARRVERHFGSHQDIEWAIARDHDVGDGLYVLQSRPVTGLPERDAVASTASALSLVMSQFGAAPRAKD
ncbi:MAG: PEP/pyruvate-binding domain-containing protein [Solirubrobacteraceae bacterium]